MSWLYASGNRGLYDGILRLYGVVPFRSPFLDISISLAAWECTRLGADVILSNPCDILHRPYIYSPLWLAASAIPVGVRDTMPIGWSLNLVFLLSLSLLPPPRSLLELALIWAATLSTMVVFAVERANLDILLFMLALAAGLLAEHRLGLRLVGYCLGLVAALLKYYPIMILVIVFRERGAVCCLAGLAIVASLAVFLVAYHAEIARGLPNTPGGPYDTDLFAAQNLPFLLGMMAEHLAAASAFASAIGRVTTVGLYTILVGASLALCRRLLGRAGLPAAFASLSGRDRNLLVIGSAVIVGCFFAGQSIGYRGVFLLLVLPGLLAITRAADRRLGALARGTGIVIVLLMWGECLRLALHQALAQAGIGPVAAGGVHMLFWLTRELAWWWAVSVMLAVVAEFLRGSPAVLGLSGLFRRLAARVG